MSNMSKKLKPLRKVTAALRRGGRSINGGFDIRWWDLTLECGHEEERPLRFPKQVGVHKRRGFMVMHHPRPLDEALPAPKRVRCGYCPNREDTTP